MFKEKTAVLLHGDSPHYIDHLAPLAILFDLPLLYTHQEFGPLFSTFYPTLKANRVLLSNWDEVLSKFDTLITCEPQSLVKPYLSIPSHLAKKEIELIWCPHGNSDKGEHSYFMEALKEEKHALVYGDKMIDFLKAKGAFENISSLKVLGNYRHAYFKKYQKPFLAQKPKTPVIVYAPSWHSKAGETQLINELKMLTHLSSYQFLIKLHPNTLKRGDPSLLRIIYQMEDLPHITLIPDIPPIYPILASSDIYIGDVSSIGYDFLTFNKPLLFLYHKDKDHLPLGPLTLQKGGTTLEPKTSSELEKAICFALENPTLQEKERGFLYQYTFNTLAGEVPLDCLMADKTCT